MTDIKTRNFVRKWIKALRSNKYKQMQYNLFYNKDDYGKPNGESLFCAIGVGCHVAGARPEDFNTYDPEFDQSECFYSRPEEMFPNPHNGTTGINRPLPLYIKFKPIFTNGHKEVEIKNDIPYYRTNRFFTDRFIDEVIVWNDEKNYTFKTIANKIKKRLKKLIRNKEL